MSAHNSPSLYKETTRKGANKEIHSHPEFQTSSNVLIMNPKVNYRHSLVSLFRRVVYINYCKQGPWREHLAGESNQSLQLCLVRLRAHSILVLSNLWFFQTPSTFATYLHTIFRHFVASANYFPQPTPPTPRCHPPLHPLPNRAYIEWNYCQPFWSPGRTLWHTQSTLDT